MLRIWFTKTGDASYISLLDLQRAMGRCLKRSGLPVWYTEGFNPHIYMTFTSPLSLGQESLVESVDVKTKEELDSIDFELWKDTLNPVMPGGIEVFKVAPIVHRGEDVAFARYTVSAAQPGAKEAAEAYNAAESLQVEKKTKRAVRMLELKEIVPGVEGREENGVYSFELLLPAGMSLNVNPMLLLDAWQNAYGFPAEHWNILRTRLYTENMEIFC